MTLYQKYLVKQANKDFIAVFWWNRIPIDRLIRKGIFQPIEPVPRGKYKGRACITLATNWKVAYKQACEDDKESFRFWLTTTIAVIGTIIAAYAALK